MKITQKSLDALIDSRVEKRINEFLFPKLKMYVFPDGKKPKRATDGAVGFDFFLRAVVDPFEMDPNNPILRKSIFDFKNCPENNGNSYYMIN